MKLFHFSIFRYPRHGSPMWYTLGRNFCHFWDPCPAKRKEAIITASHDFSDLGCQAQKFGDGYCDWVNDNLQCDYDGGDCSSDEIPLTFENCPKPLWINDGICDDFTNTDLCGFDGGDCCSENVDKTYCVNCACHENIWIIQSLMQKIFMH